MTQSSERYGSIQLINIGRKSPEVFEVTLLRE